MTGPGRPLGRRIAGGSAAVAMLLATTACRPAGGSPAPDDRIVRDGALAARLERAVAARMTQAGLAGISVAVARAGEVAFAAGYGFADLAERRAAGAGTVYPIGSISKQFTAAALVTLHEQGRLSLDDPVASYAAMPEGSPSPSVRQLLSHTGGVSDARLGPALERTSDGVGMTSAQALELIRAAGYASPPGTAFEYSNGGYFIAYRVVERATGHRYADVVDEMVAGAARLPQVRICRAARSEEQAAGYRIPDGPWARAARLGRPPGLTELPDANMALVNPVCASAPDLVRWAHRLRTGQVVSPGGYGQMIEPAWVKGGERVPYGLGLQLRRYGERRAIAHSGLIGGFVSLLADFPDDDTTVAVLANTRIDEAEAIALVEAVLGAVFGESGSRWVPDSPGEQESGGER